MAMIVLPRKTDAASVEDASRKLTSAIEDPLTVVMLVFGSGPDVERALEICVARASLKAQVRRVVWIPDPEVLTDDLRASYARRGKVATVVGLKDTVAASLTPTQAKQRVFVEDAFLAAEAQTA